MLPPHIRRLPEAHSRRRGCLKLLRYTPESGSQQPLPGPDSPLQEGNSEAAALQPLGLQPAPAPWAAATAATCINQLITMSSSSKPGPRQCGDEATWEAHAKAHQRHA